ncbi:TPA: hypothetical protein ACH3X2_007420 [Trebouxia sp. C0005]
MYISCWDSVKLKLKRCRLLVKAMLIRSVPNRLCFTTFAMQATSGCKTTRICVLRQYVPKQASMFLQKAHVLLFNDGCEAQAWFACGHVAQRTKLQAGLRAGT